MCSVTLDSRFDGLFPFDRLSLQEKALNPVTPERILIVLQQVKYDVLSAKYIITCMIPDCNPLLYWYVAIVTIRPLNMTDV